MHAERLTVRAHRQQRVYSTNIHDRCYITVNCPSTQTAACLLHQYPRQMRCNVVPLELWRQKKMNADKNRGEQIRVNKEVKTARITVSLAIFVINRL